MVSFGTSDAYIASDECPEEDAMSPHGTTIALLFAAIGCVPGCASPPAVNAAGMEADVLLPEIAGYVVMDKPVGGIVAIQLPALREIVIRPTVLPERLGFPTAHALSGPDEDGRIAYIDDYFFVAKDKDRRHLLKTIRIDGQKDTEIFSRPGSAMRATSAPGKGEIGKSFALSPVGGRVVFVSRTTGIQMPSGLRTVGFLEIWDVDKKSGEKTKVQALDEGLAWFPDGKRLAFVKLIDRATVPASDSNAEDLKKEPLGDEKVSSVYILNPGTGAETFLSIGRTPAVSPDGRAVLVSDQKGTWSSVDVASGKKQSVTWHGLTQADWPKTAVIGYPAPNVVLAWCLPTKGTKVKHTTTGSFRRGMPMLTLKLTRINTEEFQTVVPYIDPRRQASFGMAKKYIGQ